MFDAPDELLWSPTMEPPNGTEAVMSTTSPDQVWWFVSVPIMIIIPAIFVAIRFYAKLRIMRKFDPADYMITAGFIVYIVMNCMSRITLSHGIGVHMWNLYYGEYIRMLFWLNIGEALYCPCVFFIKTAIVLQYLQILCPTRSLNRFVFYGGWSTIIAIFLFYFADIFLTLFICNPREKIWNDYVAGTCMNYNALVMASAMFNIISDIVILLLPVKSIWQLRITTKKKVAIIALFATGLLATVASIMRIPYMMKLEEQGARQDASYEMAWMGLWSMAEISLGIICACSLSLPKVWRERRSEVRAVLSKINKPFVPIERWGQSLMTKTRNSTHKSVPSKTSDISVPYKQQGSPNMDLAPWPTSSTDKQNSHVEVEPLPHGHV